MMKSDTDIKTTDFLTKRSTGLDHSAGFEAMCFLGLFSCCVASWSPVAGVLSVVLFCLYLILILFSAPHQLLKYLPFYFNVVANIIGCYICEYKVLYLTELHTYTGFVGSLPLLVLSRWVFLETLYIYDRHYGVEEDLTTGKLTSRSSMLLKIGSVSIGLMVALVFAVVLPHPIFRMSIDRFEYQHTYMSGTIGRIWDLSKFLIIVPILSIREHKSKFSAGIVLLYALCGVWAGHKFGIFFSLLGLFALVYYDSILKMGKGALIRACGSIGIALLLLIFGATTISTLLSGTETTRMDYVYQRTAQQGQLWWKTYDLADGKVDFIQIGHEIDGLSASNETSKNIGSQYGIYGIMYYTAPANFIDAKLSKGSQFSEAGYATAYRCLGVFGTQLFSIVLAVITALTYNALIRALMEKRLVESIIIVRLTSIIRSCLATAVFLSLFTPATIVSYVILAIMFFSRKVKSNNYSSNYGFTSERNHGDGLDRV